MTTNSYIDFGSNVEMELGIDNGAVFFVEKKRLIRYFYIYISDT